MKSRLGQELQRLALRQRRRIWLNRVSNRIPVAIWWSASVLFSGGVVHQLWFPLNAALILSLTIAPSLLLLSWTAITHKPTTDEGAADADRLLSANSLFVSAWELSRSRAPSDGVGTLLLNRAMAALPNWYQNFDTPTRSISTTNPAAAAVACFGLFFLLMPTHVQTDPSTSPAISRPGEPPQQPEKSASVLSDLLDVVENRAFDDGNQLITAREREIASQRQLQQHPSGDTPADITDIDADGTRRTDLSPPGPSTSPVAADHLRHGVLRSGGKQIHNRTPGSSIGETSDRMMTMSADFAQLNLIDITADSNARSTTFTGSDKEAGLPLSASNQPAIRPSPIRRTLKPAQMISNNMLTVEQRALVGRYFKQLEKSNGSNE
jgi:hypothetical protein